MMSTSCSVRAVVAIALVSCGTRAPSQRPRADLPLRERAIASLGVLPPAAPPSTVATLGRRLFFELRASADGTVGCVTCHEPALWGTDGLARSQGAFGRDNERNAPTVLDSVAQLAQHWHGDRGSVEHQAEQSLVGPASFGQRTTDDAARALAAIPGLADEFRRAFPRDPRPVTPVRFGEAIGAYLRTLRAPAPFDAYLAGDDAALSVRARRGLAQFLDLGCAGCHSGPLVGGTSFQRFGVYARYAEATRSSPVDPGREALTGAEADRHVFKVPPLRHVARTAPYFHDGSVASLDEAVRVMARLELDERLAPAQVADLVAFLESLTGALPETFARPPVPRATP